MYVQESLMERIREYDTTGRTEELYQIYKLM